MKINNGKEPDIVVSCSQCGSRYSYDNIEDLDTLDIKTPCTQCGFLLYEDSLNKMAAAKRLLDSDEHAKKLINEGRVEEFKRYLEKQMDLW